MSRRAPIEPILAVRLIFPRRIFAAAPGMRITWEALGVGLASLDARLDAVSEQRNLLVRRAAVQRDRRFTGESITDFGDLR